MNTQIDHVNKSYGQGESRSRVLKKISLTIEEGSICCLLGPSGSGKSTLLNILGGIDRADSGRVQVGNIRVDALTARQQIDYRRTHVGFIFQFYNLIPNLTLRENIESGAYLSRHPLDLDEMVATLGLRDHQQKFPNQVSGGQQQRAGIGRALIKRPSLLLCDEPTGALDYQTAKEVLLLLQKINRLYGTTMIIATHNQALARIFHEVIRLHDGGVKDHMRNTAVEEAGSLNW